MALDHGILNTPLSTRGVTDAEIDRHLARERKASEAQHKACRAEFAKLVSEALAMLAAIPDSRIADMGAKRGLTIKQTRKHLADAARVRPAVALAAFSRDVPQEAQA